jgi:hypothetical protein
MFAVPFHIVGFPESEKSAALFIAVQILFVVSVLWAVGQESGN